MGKNAAAVALGKRRWESQSEEERREHMRMMSERAHAGAQERAQIVMDLLDKGHTRAAIARQLGVTPGAITRIVKKMRPPTKNTV